MRVMPANNSKAIVHYWAGTYPGMLGHLYSPGGFRGPYDWLPFGLDNGAFPAWTKGEAWDEAAYRGLLERVAKAHHTPLWVLVPDVVADRDATLRSWERWAPELRGYGWPLAFAVQDGMTVGDVPDADVIFVGGSTVWKRRTMETWCKSFKRVHVGRINTEKWLWRCVEVGAESCDGTGWFRGDPDQLAGLEAFLKAYAAGVRTSPRKLPDLFAA
jgi:hypothetical protein